MLKAAASYDWLMDGAQEPVCDRFDAHVLACVLVLALEESAAAGFPLSEGTGLSSAALTEMLRAVFPHAVPLVADAALAGEPLLPEDERSLREL